MSPVATVCTNWSKMNRSRGRGNASQNRSNRREEICKQEQLLLEKKREIEERMRAAAEKICPPVPEVSADALITLPIEALSPQKDEDTKDSHEGSIEIIEGSKDDVKESEDLKNNKFANDGSFMERFRKLQEEMAAKQKASVKEEPKIIEEPIPVVEEKSTPVAKLPSMKIKSEPTV